MSKRKLFLTIDEQEALLLGIDSDLYVIINKVLGHLADRIDEQVLTYDLNRGPDGLVIAKARSEGARLLISNLAAFIEKAKEKAR